MIFLKSSDLDYDTVVVEPLDRTRRPVLYKYYQYTIVGDNDLPSVLEVERMGELDKTVDWLNLRHLPKAKNKTEIIHQICLIELGHYEPK